MLQSAACCGRFVDSRREGLDLVGLWDGSNTSAEQPREESGRSGAAHAAIRHAGLPVGSPPQPRGVRANTQTLGQEAGAPSPGPGPTPRPINAGLGASLLQAFLAKAMRGSRLGEEAEGRGRRAPGPLAPGHCL